ncbi:MAG: hypothetical protein SH857_18085 [Chitinophagales bacterium]|nr:hypothetical protein [Chitinophagales bacterium]
MIQYLQRKEVDDNKWNACIQQAANSYPYAFTWYLDCVAEQWDALVSGDYDAVFPLVWNRRFLIHYLYQPMFTQQLGVFSKNVLDEKTLHDFLEAIPVRYCFIEINVNYQNPVRHPSFEIIPRTNSYLELQSPYEKLYQAYHENTKRNVQKALKNNLHVSENLKAEAVIEFFKTNSGIKIPELGEYQYEHLEELIAEVMQRQMGKLIGVQDTNENLFAAGFFIVTENKIINLLPSTGEDGKNNGAGFLMIDYLIRKFAGSDKTLDFEGSMIPGIARFYKNFGAQEQTYWRLRRNNLPWFAKWIKG